MRNPVNPLLSYRGFFGSPLYLSDVNLLEKLAATRPFWVALYDGTIGAQQTDRGQVIIRDDCWLVALMGSSGQAAGFVAQFFDTQRGKLFQDTPVNFANGEGTAQKPFWLKKPQLLPSPGQVQSRVINLATVSNAIQIVGLAYRPDMRVKLT